MLPEHTLSSEPVPGKYILPTGKAKHPLEYYELGGIATQDPSAGLRYQTWYGYYDPVENQAWIKGMTTDVATIIFVEPDVVEFSFCFDQNMRWAAVVKLEDGTVKFKWYNTEVEAYVTTVYPATYISPKLTLDDKRALELPHMDMLLTYIRDNCLYVREQRSRFNVEYLLKEDLPENVEIAHFGMTDRLRLQWKFSQIRR